MGKMGLPSFSIDENIIKENQDKMAEERIEDMIHETLKSGGRIIEVEWNNQELIVILMSYECSLGNVLFFHTKLVVSRAEIKFGKILITT
jgi:hypothetical protein